MAAVLAGMLVAALAACGSSPGEGSADDASRTAATGGSETDRLFDVDWRALGTEPFWGVRISRDRLVFTGIDRDSLEFPSAEPERRGDTVVLSPDVEGRSLEVVLRRRACSDGMSDRRYEWAAEIVVEGEELRGCAIRDPLPAPAERGAAADARGGFAEQVRYARQIRATSGRFERVEGTLGTRHGAEALFVAWFGESGPVAIDLNIKRGGASLFETSYFFAPSPAGENPVLRLVESDRWDADSGAHTSYLIAFDPDGSMLDGVYEVEGAPAEPPRGLAGAELAGARDLLAAARAQRSAIVETRQT